MDTERKAACACAVYPKKATRTERIEEERTPRENQRKSLRRGREAKQTRRETERERGKEKEREKRERETEKERERPKSRRTEKERDAKRKRTAACACMRAVYTKK